MTLFAYGEGALKGEGGDGLLHGLKLVSVAIVAQAVLGMARSLAPDRPRATIAVLSLILMAFAPAGWAHVAVILLGAIAGLILCRQDRNVAVADVVAPISRRMAIVCRRPIFSSAGAVVLPGAVWRDRPRRRLLSLGRAGVRRLPLLRTAVVDPGWVSDSAFLAGYGAAQAMPGPLFTFAAYLGAVAGVPPGGTAGAALALVSIFAPVSCW